MNEDILHVVLKHMQPRALTNMCRVSKAISTAATWRFYGTVHITSISSLSSFHRTLFFNERIPRLVLNFVDQIPSERRFVSYSTWPNENGADGIKISPAVWNYLVLDTLERLVNVQSVSLASVSSPLGVVPGLFDLLARLSSLRHVSIPDVVRQGEIEKLGQQHSLESISLRAPVVSGTQHHLYEWLTVQALRLHYLRIDDSRCLAWLAAPPRNVIFPVLRTLVSASRDFRVDPCFAAMFPSLRRLYSAMVTDAEKLQGYFPHLQHLHLCLDPVWRETLPEKHIQEHSLASLHLELSKLGDSKTIDVGLWASPHVRALRLDCKRKSVLDTFATHVTALKSYPCLDLLDVAIHGKAATWIRAFNALPACLIPPNLVIITLRHVEDVHAVLPDDLELLLCRPAMRLVRLIDEQTGQRRVWPPILGWSEGCDMVARRLPHWNETRAPWDDINDL